MNRRISALPLVMGLLLASCATVPTAYRFDPVSASAKMDSAAAAKKQIVIEGDSLLITIAFDRVDEPNFIFDVNIENRAESPLLVMPEFFYYVVLGDNAKRLYYAQNADDVIADIDTAIAEIKADVAAARVVFTASARIFMQQLKEDLTRLTELRSEVAEHALREARLLKQEKAFGKIYFPVSPRAEKIELAMLLRDRRYRAVFERAELAEPILPASVAQPRTRR